MPEPLAYNRRIFQQLLLGWSMHLAYGLLDYRGGAFEAKANSRADIPRRKFPGKVFPLPGTNLNASRRLQTTTLARMISRRGAPFSSS
jgi:hypothetical protein